MSMDPRVSVRDDPRKRVAPASDRNKIPIFNELRRLLPVERPCGIFEVASGTGQHAAYMAQNLPNATWYTSEYDTTLFDSINAYVADISNVRAPAHVDVCTENWPSPELGPMDAMLCVNLLHISPPQCIDGLLRGASRGLRDDGVLCIYGPFKVNGKATTESNAEFDARLKERDPTWGLRDISEICGAVERHGLPLSLAERIEMPANNFMLVFRKIARSILK
eukprot:Rmarinus@m.13797